MILFWCVIIKGGVVYAFLDLAFGLVDVVLRGGVQTPSHRGPFKLWFEFDGHRDQLFARQGCGQRSKNLIVFPNELTETRVKVHALQVRQKILLSMEVAPTFLLFLHTPHGFTGQLILPVLVTLLHVVEGVYQRYLRIGESHFFIILLGPYRRFLGPPEEVQAGPSLDTFSLSP